MAEELLNRLRDLSLVFFPLGVVFPPHIHFNDLVEFVSASGFAEKPLLSTQSDFHQPSIFPLISVQFREE